MDIASHQFDLPSAVGEDEIVGHAFVIVQKVILDYIRLVTKAEDEILVAVMGVILHHVPEDRTGSDIDHGFRYVITVLPNPHSEATTKQYDFHSALSDLF